MISLGVAATASSLLTCLGGSHLLNVVSHLLGRDLSIGITVELCEDRVELFLGETVSLAQVQQVVLYKDLSFGLVQGAILVCVVLLPDLFNQGLLLGGLMLNASSLGNSLLNLLNLSSSDLLNELLHFSLANLTVVIPIKRGEQGIELLLWESITLTKGIQVLLDESLHLRV